MSSASANDAAAQALANRAESGGPLDALLQQFEFQTGQELLNLIMADLAAGINPREMARDISNTLDEISYGRAETIARTESLTSWNDAALENYRANSDIVGSWMWMCMPGAGTCVSCLEEDGTIYSLDEELDDHPNGRCVKAPVTNDYGTILDEYGIPWSEGDFGPGPWDDRQSGEEWLLAQDAEMQRQAFGSNAAYNAWKSGDAQLKDFVKIRHDPVYGDSIQQQSLRGMGLNARDYSAGSMAERAAKDAEAKAAAEREAEAKALRDELAATKREINKADKAAREAEDLHRESMTRWRAALVDVARAQERYDRADAAFHEADKAHEAARGEKALAKTREAMRQADIERQIAYGQQRAARSLADAAERDANATYERAQVLRAEADRLAASAREAEGFTVRDDLAAAQERLTTAEAHWEAVRGELPEHPLYVSDSGAPGAVPSKVMSFSDYAEQRRALLELWDAQALASATEVPERVAAEAEQTAARELAAKDLVTAGESRFIAERDVAAWTADNAPGVPDVGYHYGSDEHIARLEREGVDETRGTGGFFGRGFYTYSQPNPEQEFGESYVRVAIKSSNPLIGTQHDILELQNQMEREHPDWPKHADFSQLGEDRNVLGERAHPFEKLFSEELVQQGYDGILITGNAFGAPDVFIAIKQDTVRVINDAKAAEVERGVFAPVREGAAAEARVASEAERAAITVDRSNEVFANTLRDYFRRDLTDQEIAGLSGALPGSEVRLGRGNILEVTGPDGSYRAAVRVLRNDDGSLGLFNWNHWAGTGTSTADITAPSPEELELQVRTARDLGMSGILVKANDEARDAVALADLGFDARLDTALRIEVKGQEFPAEFAGARTLGDLLQMPGGREWWAEHAASPSLIFDTREGSWSSRQLEQVLSEKAAATVPTVEETRAVEAAIAVTADDAARASLSDLFGRDLSDQEIGGLIGARAGDRIEAYTVGDHIQLRLLGESTPLADGTPGYNALRSLSRDPATGDLVMENASFFVAPELQGQGIGVDVFSSEAQRLSDLGVARIETPAAGVGNGYVGAGEANGYYTWARFGYDGAVHWQAMFAHGLDIATVPNNLRDLTTIQEIMRAEGGPAFWKEWGWAFNGTFDLAPDSLSMRVLREYLRLKGRE